jgi:hypothetical protein
MTLTFYCPGCGQRYELEDLTETIKVQCTVCQVKFYVTTDGQVSEIIAQPPTPKFAPPPPPRAPLSPRMPMPPPGPTKKQFGMELLKTALVMIVAAGIGFVGYRYYRSSQQTKQIAASSVAPATVTPATVAPEAPTVTPLASKPALPPPPKKVYTTFAERADNYEQALARAKETGKDIVVLQRGSDWNKFGEILYNNIWLTDEFAGELGDNFILVTVDHQEVVGGRSVLAQRSASGAAGSSDNSPPLHLAKLSEQVITNEIVAMESQGRTTYKRRADGAWLATGENPGQDVITLTIKAPLGGNVVRLDFPTDPSLPGNGPGRAGNGNFAVSEAVVLTGATTNKLVAAWASAYEGNWGAWQTIDGIADRNDSAWNALAHQHQRRTLLLEMASPVPAGAELEVQLICRSQWGQHVPGCFTGTVLADKSVAADVLAVGKAQWQLDKNRKFSWWDTGLCPRIALMDSKGRAVGCENKPSPTLTVKTMAARVKELEALREKRDELWDKVEETSGNAAKAELLRQSLDLLGFANWTGNDNCYQFIHDKIRFYDPKDESGAVRWLGFGGDPRNGVPWAEPSWNKALEKPNPTDADYEEALARVDKELKDPRNRVLDHERIQRIMIAKFHIYRRWPGHDEKRFDVQREIAKLDPNTFWGIGAIGYLGMCQKSDTPMLTYGWGTGQLKAGLNTWNITDTAIYFDHAGPYKFRLTFTGGRDQIKVARIALLDGNTVVSEAAPDDFLGPQRNAVEVSLNLSKEHAGHPLVLCAEIDVATGHTDNNGNFSVEPDLLPPPPSPAGPARQDYAALQRQLAAKLMPEAAQGAAGMGRILATPELRAMLAQHELIRICGVDKVNEVAARPAGSAFLKDFFANTDWIESFLASDPAEYPQSLENLRLLYQYDNNLNQPLPRRIATALALMWGGGSRYRLVDRFQHVVRADAEGLLHVSFDNLTVREMRWAIPTYGRAKDYQFLIDDRQMTLGDYFGACWAVAYIDTNVYGDSVQGGAYVAPWMHYYGTGHGNRPFAAHRIIGGVCGALSGFGSAVAQAHGIMSCTVGQPGHCAYVIRSGQEWPVAYSVTWPTYAGAPGWDGTGYSTMTGLYEPVEQDRAHFMNAMRMAWIARMQMDRTQVHAMVEPGLKYSMYQYGVGAALPDFSKLSPEKTGTVSRIDLGAVQPASPQNFGVVWEGSLSVTGNGALRVSAQSDDSSRVLVDGRPVVSANCNRQENEITLTAGRHPLRVEFSQGGGDLQMVVGFSGVPVLGSWTNTYEQAIAMQPTNYIVWLEYIKALENVKGVAPSMWLELGKKAARTFAVCNEAGWALTMRCLNRVLSSLPPMERFAALVECNRSLRQDNWVRPNGYPFDGILNWQADQVGDPKLAVALYGKMLSIHHSKNPDNNWIFGQVLNWGGNRFGSNPAIATDYAKAMESFLQAQGADVDKNLLANTISTGIRKASETGDLASYRLWTQMVRQMLPPLKPQDVHLNDAQAAAVPKYLPFPGELLSKSGMLRTSSACGSDRPFSYQQVLSGGFGGWFDTNNEEKPWAQVQLAGDCALTGVILLNRYEFAPTQDEFQWATPMMVSISTDGKSWTDVAKITKAAPVFRIDLQGKRPRARYVRIERLPDADKSKSPGRFHFRNFLVYGTRLY